MEYSIRRRLTVALALGFVTVFCGAGLFVSDRVSERLLLEFDAALEARARTIQSLIESDEGQIEFDYESGSMPEFVRESRPDHFQIWLDDGSVLFRSKRLRADDLQVPKGHDQRRNVWVGDTSMPDGRAARSMWVSFLPRRERVDDQPESAATTQAVRGLVLVVARDRQELDALLSSARWTVFGAGAVGILLAMLWVWRVLAISFRPLEDIAGQVRCLDADRLESRVQLRQTPAELAPIVEHINELLARLHASFDRQRRFAANVAHELRTPIAELRSLAEVGERWPDDRQAVADFFRDTRVIAGRMEAVITDLLLLARCQAGVEPVQVHWLDLRQAIETEWGQLSRLATDRGLRLVLVFDGCDSLRVRSDPSKLGIVLANLLRNAVDHSLGSGEVRVCVERHDNRLRLEIANPAAQLEEQDLSRLTDPFWRKDESRASTEHAGLGLSLVSALTPLLNLSLEIDQDSDGTFRVTLTGEVSAEDSEDSPESGPKRIAS